MIVYRAGWSEYLNWWSLSPILTLSTYHGRRESGGWGESAEKERDEAHNLFLTQSRFDQFRLREKWSNISAWVSRPHVICTQIGEFIHFFLVSGNDRARSYLARLTWTLTYVLNHDWVTGGNQIDSWKVWVDWMAPRLEGAHVSGRKEITDYDPPLIRSLDCISDLIGMNLPDRVNHWLWIHSSLESSLGISSIFSILLLSFHSWEVGGISICHLSNE